MATTGVLSALAQEQQGLLAQLRHARQVRRAGRDFWLGDLHGAPVVLALSRIGKVAAATTATTLIEALGVERIVFTGVAGALAMWSWLAISYSTTWTPHRCSRALRSRCTDRRNSPATCG